MQIYHTETQEDYDALMVELEKRGCLWVSGDKPTSPSSRWSKYTKSGFCVCVDGKLISFASKNFYKEYYPDIPIQKYKAKQNDVVNSPKHYTQNGRETIENIRDTMSSEGFQGYCTGNVVKYLAKYKFKNGLEDVRKAKKYIEFLEAELIKQEG